MKSENEALNLVVERFPKHAVHIEYLFKNDEHFHEICMDYQLAIQHLKQFIQNDEKAGIQEYENLRKDLEKELVELNKINDELYIENKKVDEMIEKESVKVCWC